MIFERKLTKNFKEISKIRTEFLVGYFQIFPLNFKNFVLRDYSTIFPEIFTGSGTRLIFFFTTFVRFFSSPHLAANVEFNSNGVELNYMFSGSAPTDPLRPKDSPDALPYDPFLEYYSHRMELNSTPFRKIDISSLGGVELYYLA